MDNKNKFRSLLIGKRISYSGLAFSVALFIISIISFYAVDYFARHSNKLVPLIVIPPDHPSRLAYYYFYEVLFPSMILSSIMGMIILTLLNRILSIKLKNLSPISSQVELKLNQKYESFRFKRTQEYGYWF